MKNAMILFVCVVCLMAHGGESVENADKVYAELSDAGNIVERIRVWPGLAPHETTNDLGRFVYNEKRKFWSRLDISAPELVIFRPVTVKHDTVVMAMPGGGYHVQNVSSLCHNVKPILESGRWVAVLHYRIPRRPGRHIYDAPREDAARAVRYLRANAARYGYSPEKIGAIGFSAGGHLAAVSATSSQDTLYDRVDELDDLSAHLNFAIPVYPAYVLNDGATKANENCGDGAALMPEFKFDAKTPPMCLVHGDKDKYSPMGSVLLYTELHRRKIPAQLFIYANGGHGFPGDAVNYRGWQTRMVDWLDSMGF